MKPFDKILFKWAAPWWLLGFVVMWIGRDSAAWVRPTFATMLVFAAVFWPWAISDALRR